MVNYNEANNQKLLLSGYDKNIMYIYRMYQILLLFNIFVNFNQHTRDLIILYIKLKLTHCITEKFVVDLIK